MQLNWGRSAPEWAGLAERETRSLLAWKEVSLASLTWLAVFCSLTAGLTRHSSSCSLSLFFSFFFRLHPRFQLQQWWRRFLSMLPLEQMKSKAHALLRCVCVLARKSTAKWHCWSRHACLLLGRSIMNWTPFPAGRSTSGGAVPYCLVPMKNKIAKHQNWRTVRYYGSDCSSPSKMADGLVQSLGLGRSASHNQIDLDDYLYLVYDYPSKHVPYVSYLGTDIDLSIYIYI